MLSKSEERLLKWMIKQEKPLSIEDMKSNCKGFRTADLKSLHARKYIRTTYNPDTGWADYVTEPKAEEYFREARRDTAVDIREWITLAIAVLALILSVISLALQYTR